MPPCVTELPTHLTAVKAQPRLLSIGEDLPERHAQHPRVTSMRVLPALEALWRAPAGNTNERDQNKRIHPTILSTQFDGNFKEVTF